MKSNRLTIIGVLVFFLLCLVPNGNAQSCLPVSQPPGTTWQLGLKCTFNSSSTPVAAFPVDSLLYFQVFWTDSGTISAASLSLDSSPTGVSGSFSTGGILSAATIGSLASANNYANSSPVTPTHAMQITPSITGTGTITVTIYGYINPPSSTSSGPATSVQVTNTPNVDVSNTPNVDVSNTYAPSGPIAITGSNSASVTVGGAGCGNVEITVVTGTFSAGNLLFKWSPDGVTFYPLYLYPTIDGLPSGPSVSSVPYSSWAAGDVWAGPVPNGGTLEAVGDGTFSGGTSLTVVVNATQANSCFPYATEYSTSQPASSAGASTPLQGDQSGNLLQFPGVQFRSGTAWNSSTSSGTFQYPTGTSTEGQLPSAPAYLVQLDQTTTITGGAVTIQGTYDNVNWITVPTAQVVNPQTCAALTNPYSLVASTNQPFLVVASGFLNIRLDLSTAISGSATVTPYWQTLSNPGNCANAQPISNGNQVGAISSAGSNVGQLAIVVPPVSASNTNALSAGTVVTLTSGSAGVNVKSSSGNFYGAYVYNANASAQYLELLNSSGAGTIGTESFDWLIPATTGMWLPVPGGFAFDLTSGIAVACDTTKAGSTACSSAMTVTVFYK